MDLAHLADLWEENQEYLKQRMGQSESTRFGARWVLMRSVPVPLLNHVSMVRIPAESVADLVAECRAFYRGEGLPGCCILTTPATRPATLADDLYRLGFTTELNPVMIWDGITQPDAAPGIQVEMVGREGLDLVFHLVKETFFPDSSPQHESWLRLGVEITDQIGALNYVAYLSGEPVGVGTLFCRGAMGGIYNMGTLPRYRGRGVAKAIMRRCLADARAMGCHHVGLTPTRLGRPLYEQLGFQVIYQECYFYERFG